VGGILFVGFKCFGRGEMKERLDRKELNLKKTNYTSDNNQIRKATKELSSDFYIYMINAIWKVSILCLISIFSNIKPSYTHPLNPYLKYSHRTNLSFNNIFLYYLYLCPYCN
jgi:hypothetical protein